VAQFGDVFDRRLWRMKGEKRSGETTSIAKRRASKTTMLQQEERALDFNKIKSLNNLKINLISRCGSVW
jgi:hypothetical protein